MALYQPSNITPSTFAGIGGGVVDANDYWEISFQVNGTSPLTHFVASIQNNDAESAEVGSVSWAWTNGFYGTDANGNVDMLHVVSSQNTWANKGVVNGNSYKLKITQYWKNNPEDTSETEKYVVQTSDSVFIARAAPTLSVSPASGTLATVSQDFTASFAQAQGDSVSWVRWVLTDTTAGNVIEDTGTLYTGLLAYSYNGFFSGKTYTLSCTVETSSGVTKTVTNTYAVSYESLEQTGGVTAICNADDSVTLTWTAGRYIPGFPSADDYGEILNGVLHLAASRSVTWNKVNGSDMAYTAPYCFAWRGKIAQTVTSDPASVSSGTWTADGTSTSSHTTSRSQTVSTNMWGLNPSAPSTEKTTVTNVAIPVTTTQSHYTGEWISSQTRMSSVGSFSKNNRTYTYRTGTAATISLSNTITSYIASRAWYRNNDGTIGPTLNDAYLEITQTSSNSLSIIIYTNNTEAYNKYVQASVYCTVSSAFTGSVTRAPESGDTITENPNPQILWYSDDLTNVSIVWNGSNFVITANALSSGTYYVNYQYTRDYRGNDKYRAQFEGVLNTSGATLTGVTINSAGGTSAYGIPNKNLSGNTEQNHYVVTVYNATNSSSVTCSYTLNYTTESVSSYKSVVSGAYTDLVPGATSVPVGASVLSTTAQNAAVVLDTEGNYTVTFKNNAQTSCTASIELTFVVYPDNSNLMTVSDGTAQASLGIFGSGAQPIMYMSGTNISAKIVRIIDGAWYAAVYVTSDRTMYVTYFGSDQSYLMTVPVGWSSEGGELPAAVSSVSIAGEQECDYIYLTRNADYPENTGYTPYWDSDTLLFADFISNLQAGPTDAVPEELPYTGSAGYVNYPAGTVSDSSTTYKKTDFIDVGHYNYLSYKRLKSTSVLNMGMCFYDSAQNLISNSGARVLIRQDANGYADDTVPVPAGAKYARFTYYAANTYGEFAVSGVIVTATTAVYRNDGDTLQYIGTFGDGSTSIRDYGIRSGRQYVYDMYYEMAGEYSEGAESSPICRQFRQHTLIEAEEDATLSNVYHPVHVWRFGNNLDAGAYTNQNSPVLLQNFTKYPLWQPSSQASRSGTLVALLGKMENGEYYGDNAAAMDALFALSESVNPLFYRDMKGNLYMVRLAGPIMQTINNRTGVLEVSVSVPWVEVGDAADVKIYTEG